MSYFFLQRNCDHLAKTAMVLLFLPQKFNSLGSESEERKIETCHPIERAGLPITQLLHAQFAVPMRHLPQQYPAIIEIGARSSRPRTGPTVFLPIAITHISNSSKNHSACAVRADPQHSQQRSPFERKSQMSTTERHPKSLTKR